MIQSFAHKINSPYLLGTPSASPTEPPEVEDPPPVPPATANDSSPTGVGGTWEDVADEDSTASGTEFCSYDDEKKKN